MALTKYDNKQLLQYLREEIENKRNHEVTKMCNFQGVLYTPLRLALKLDKPMEVIIKLIDIGGKDMVMMNGLRSALHWVCCMKSTNSSSVADVISKMIKVGGKELVMLQDGRGESALHWACKNENILVDVISKMLEVGGKELVMMENKERETALHCACKNENSSNDIISKMLEVGGKELVMMRGGNIFHQMIDIDTALHVACRNRKISIGIISKLLGAGGRDLVMTKDRCGHTALQYACENNNISTLIISKLLEVGGKELVMIKSNIHGTALHYACKNKSISIGIVSKLLLVGAKELVVMKTRRHVNALHCACANANIGIDVISKLIEVGGKDLLVEKNKDGDIALHYGYFSDRFSSNNDHFSDAFAFIIKQCILANIGGEFGIGGLFGCARQEVQNMIYEKWEQLSPALESTMMSLEEEQRPPILHAALLADASLHIIRDIINRFGCSVLKVDSLNRIPIEIAIDKCLSLVKGMQEIVNAMALEQHQSSSIYVVAKYGLKWSNHMKELAETSVDEIVNGFDCLTGLRLFMVAAMGDKCDLSTIYGVMKMSPEQVVDDLDECTHKQKKARV